MNSDQTYIHTTIEKIQFSILSNDNIEKMSVVEINDSKMAGPNTVYAPELGSIDKKPCVICGNSMKINGQDCPGHFGHIKLNYPIANPLFKEDIAAYARCFCNKPICARIIVTQEQMKLENFFKKDGEARIQSIKDFVDCIEECPHCENPHGKIKYLSKENKFVMSYNKNEEVIPVSYKLLYDIFNNIRDEDLLLLGFNKEKISHSKPANLMIKNLLVIPVACRPPVSSGEVECHDDITYKYIDIIKINNKLANIKDLNEKKIKEYIDNIDFHATMLMDNTKRKITDNKNRMFKCIHSRIKGKNGLIRKNMCGKRVDFCGRTVIGPEANCMVDEMIIPEEVSKKLSFPVKVNALNIDQCYKWIEENKVNNIIKEDVNGRSIFDMKYAAMENVGTTVTFGDIIKRGEKIMTYDTIYYAKGKVDIKEGDMVMRDNKFVPIILPKRKKIVLKEGYIVERHLMNGDWVVLNRQPSLRAESLRAKKIKILPGKTFRFNLASTEAYNADFDGDEMNIWVPQSYESIAELVDICSVEANFTTSQHSRPIIAMKQDAMTGGYLLTYGDVKIDKATFFDCLTIEMDMDVMGKYDHIRDVYRWKGIEKEVSDKLLKEKDDVFEKIENLLDKKDRCLKMLKKSNELTDVEKNKLERFLKNIDFKLTDLQDRYQKLDNEFDILLEEELMYNGRTLFSFLMPDDFEYSFSNNMSSDGKPVLITRGVMISGTLNKLVIGSSSGSISHIIRLNYSAKRACEFVSYYQMVINRWLLTRGFSVGIEDCIPQKMKFVKSESNKCFSQALLYMQTEEDKDLKEMKINNSLNNARDVGQRIAKESLSPYNSFVCMIRSGAKGNDNNITQITSMLGQQNIEGKRMPLVFNKRALPHFIPDLEDYITKRESNTNMLETLFSSRGFVHSGFYNGLSPAEFYFHAVGGREGLIDTAVKTADTGYMQRKMVKLLEDLQVTYRGTVEDSAKHIISFDYGGDNFDGSKIIYRNNEPLFMDIDTICNKLNADHEWEQFQSKLKNKIEVIEEEKEMNTNIQQDIDDIVSDLCQEENLSANEKRKNSCKKVGSEKKKSGHSTELDFKKKYDNSNSSIEYGAKADANISKNHDIFNKLKEIGYDKDEASVSIKSGANLQFTLGKIPELSKEDSFEWLQSRKNCKSLFNKYLKKSESDSPCDLLVYKDEETNKWIFFVMDDVVNYISKGTWRKLDSGRMKLDFKNNKDKYVQLITYEVRKTHSNSQFLGANGNRGKELIKILKENIDFIEDDTN
jgi:DNA-directed RNA polymerase beta' subunit